MRRSDREVTDFQEIVSIMEHCDVCRIAFHRDGYPYILPFNFGMTVTGKTVELYFHGATEGTKYRLIEQNPCVGFEMDRAHRLIADRERGYCTMEYESVVGTGQIELLPETETYRALCILMKHYHQETFPFAQTAIPRTRVFKLTVHELTGKRRKTKA